jgi:ornithine lipid ester-linked acyl 2-hydroxylase
MANTWPVRISAVVLKRLRIPMESILSNASKVENREFLELDIFDWTGPLEKNWRRIREELEQVLKTPIPRIQEISTLQESLTNDDGWKVFFLYGHGFKSVRNCQRCPVTAELLGKIPGLRTAFFSVLEQGKTLPLHRGPYKGLLRYHLGLIVPSEDPEVCGIRVGEETRSWSEGHGLVFDDTYFHAAWNKSEGKRVVLFVDIERPLSEPVATLNKMVLRILTWTPYVRDAKRRQNAWELLSEKGVDCDNSTHS